MQEWTGQAREPFVQGRPSAGIGDACVERAHSPTSESGSLPAVPLQPQACPDGCPRAPAMRALALHRGLVSRAPGSQEPPGEEFACHWELRRPGAPLAEDGQELSLFPLLAHTSPRESTFGGVSCLVFFTEPP